MSNRTVLLTVYEKRGYVEVRRHRLEEYIPKDYLNQEERGLQMVVMQKRKRDMLYLPAPASRGSAVCLLFLPSWPDSFWGFIGDIKIYDVSSK